MAKTNMFEKVEQADWLAQQRNPDFDWDGYFCYKRAKNEKKELQEEFSYWLKATLGSLISMLVSPIMVALGLMSIVQDVMGWSMEITILVVSFTVVAITISLVKHFVCTLDMLNSAAYRYIGVVRIIKNAQK